MVVGTSGIARACRNVMSATTHADPAEQDPILRYFCRDWRPTRAGRIADRIEGWIAGQGVSPDPGLLEVRGRISGPMKGQLIVSP